MWNFGVLSFIFLISQVVTGVLLSMYYAPHEAFAFVSVESVIMRDVSFGWLLRYMHSNGASFFFICVYIHLFRSLYYFSYVKPRLVVWNIGVIILLLMIITAFTGYVLPWGQMSYWAATVITNLFSAIPIFGEYIVLWLWGSFSVSSITLNRFFTFHFVFPFLLLFFVFLHFVFLHKVGSSNNLLINKKVDKIMFHPFYSFKDLIVIFVVLIIFFVFIWFAPNYLSHPDNYVMADSLSTPAHIVPEWYFSVFYAMLRSIPSKLGGILVLLLSILILFIFPFFIKIFFNQNLWNAEKIVYAPTRALFRVFWKASFFKMSRKAYSYRRRRAYYILYRTISLFKINFLFFVLVFVVLSFIGMKPIEYPYLEIGRIFTYFYFFYFFNLVFSFYVKYLVYFCQNSIYGLICLQKFVVVWIFMYPILWWFIDVLLREALRVIFVYIPDILIWIYYFLEPYLKPYLKPFFMWIVRMATKKKKVLPNKKVNV